MSEPDAPAAVPSSAVPRTPVVPAQQASRAGARAAPRRLPLVRLHAAARPCAPDHPGGAAGAVHRRRVPGMRPHLQNPRLTAEGLAFHRRTPRGAPGTPSPTTSSRCATPRAAAGPRPARCCASANRESWLDVGTGHGRFPDTAREFFPYTAFDGTDLTARVERARILGRVEEAAVGALTDPKLLARVAARYDVVSLLHHLEHTTDPRAELRAALDCLRPGGHLLVETLDPRCAFAALFGNRWLSYDQPRRLHLLPPRNLRAELEALGCAIVTTRSVAAGSGTSRSATAKSRHRALYVLTWPAPPRWPSARPCPPRTPPGARSRRPVPAAGACRLLARHPLVAVAALTDLVLAPVLRHTPFANAYRIIARKPTD
ncbi:methyltransferase domain-containing protein [Streptomyces hirsutus]